MIGLYDALGRPLLGLLEAETQTPFSLRRSIADATSLGDLKVVSARLSPAMLALHDAGVPPDQIGGVVSIVTDALTRRLIDLIQMEIGAAPRPFTWLALGSMGRREIVPSSDVDSALVWDGDERNEEHREYMATLGKKVVEGPVSIPDFHATVLCALGIDPAKELFDGPRPVPATDGGRPIRALFA